MMVLMRPARRKKQILQAKSEALAVFPPASDHFFSFFASRALIETWRFLRAVKSCTDVRMARGR